MTGAAVIGLIVYGAVGMLTAQWYWRVVPRHDVLAAVLAILGVFTWPGCAAVLAADRLFDWGKGMTLRDRHIRGAERCATCGHVITPAVDYPLL